MSDQQRHNQRIQHQLQALTIEIKNLRNEYVAAIEDHDSMRAQVMASQFSMESLGRRLQEAEDRQRQLLEQLASVVLPPIGTGRGQSESSNGAGIRRGTRDPHVSLPIDPGAPGLSPAFSRSNTSEVTSNSTIRQRDHPAPTPLPRNAHLQPQRNNPRNNLVPLRVPPQTTSSPQAQRATFGSMENAVYLPMIIENIVFEHKRVKSEGRLRTCGFVVGQRDGDSNLQCSQPCFNVPCFRANHFHYCRAHMKIVPAGKTVCSRRQSRDCKVVTYEDRIDWEIIVGAAIEAGNLGGKGLDVQDLREALFPPQFYPHQWI
ncbi:hypothetical protein PTMSG1_05803 [Pyrenophora teres f. maculata]|nr:hypothetical protein PTMSG1_05803 [Pyrenophora teres f. maculata]